MTPTFVTAYLWHALRLAGADMTRFRLLQPIPKP